MKQMVAWKQGVRGVSTAGSFLEIQPPPFTAVMF
jgi:hypothetical protein